MRGDGDEQARRHGGEENPAADQQPGRFRSGKLHLLEDCIHTGSQHDRAASSDQRDEQREAATPQPTLRVQSESRLEQQRVGEKREKTADVGSGIEKIGVVRFAVAGTHKPRLQKWVVRGEREEWQPDRNSEQAQQPEGRPGCRRRAPVGNRQRQRDECAGQERKVHGDSQPAILRAHEKMRIGIAGQQHRLEEHHRDRPDRR